MDNKKIGSFISERRKEQGMNQKELAQKLCVTDKAVSKWETGRGVPDISILTPLAETLGVTVGEILSGERKPAEAVENDDEKIIKKLKIKRYIKFAVEFVITIVFAQIVYMYFDTFNDFRNVIDAYLHRDEIEFLALSSIIFIALFLIWILVFGICAFLKKKAEVLKTIIICTVVSFFIGSSVHMAYLEDNRHAEIFDKPIDSVSYISYEDFFDNAYDTQITIKDTNEYIIENYSAYFSSKVEDKEYNFVNTDCVTSSEESVIKKYYDEKRTIYTRDCEYSDIDNSLCEQLGIAEGYYTTNNYSNCDIELHIIKDKSCYDIEISNKNIIDDQIIKEIRKL